MPRIRIAELTGYKVKDVKVNGKSVGAVKTYTIDKLTVSTRIEVEFTDESLPFTDVRRSDWFYEDVAFAYENGLFAGTSDTTFSPNASMTRAMLVTVLYRSRCSRFHCQATGNSDR